jgi:glycosyltransferase involved in cell wall biosynthesis
MHLAAAAAVPVVAVFGGGHWPRFLPSSSTGAVHTQDLPCFGCGWRDCVFGDAPCVGRVDEAQVRRSVARVLDGGAGLEVHQQPPLTDLEVQPSVLDGYRALSEEAARRLDGLLSRDAEIARLGEHIRHYDQEIRRYAEHIRLYDETVRSLRQAIDTYEGQAHEREVRIREQQADIRRLDATARHAPLVSIVTPTFNAARFVERCILSVREQDYPKVEHIIVDGGSTDGTLDVCARYPHLVVHSAPDRGQSDALNRGFAMARGEILAWLCADDEYLPGALSNAVDSVLEGNDLVVGNCQFIDAEGRRITAHPVNARRLIDHRTVLRFWRVTLPQPATFWRRRLWERCGPLREDLHFTMDFDLWLRMTRVAAVERLGVDLAAYRIHPDAKCFADNYGSRLELLEVSRGYWPPRWHPGHWRLALEHWLSGRDITRHYTEAERLRDRAFHKLRARRRLEAFVAFAKMHAVHPRSPSLPEYRKLVRKLAGSVVPFFLIPFAEAALKRLRRRDRVAA